MSDIVIINEVFRRRRGRMRKSGTRGRDRYTIEMETEPILHQFDDRVVGKGVAEAIAKEIAAGIKAVKVAAKPATLAFRRRAAKAFSRGRSWAKKRYAGGRTGPTPPNTGDDTLFSDSGRFANGIAVRLNRTDKSFTVNVPANRLDDRDFNDLSFRRFLRQLRQHVPALNPAKLGSLPSIQRAVSDSIDELIIVARNERDAKLKALKAQQKATAIALARGLISIAS